MNFVIFSGRLVKDPEIRYTGDKKAVATFTIAVDRFHKGEKTTDFFKCGAFGPVAERVDQYCIKGSPVIVSGEMHNNNWTDKEGNKHKDNEVAAFKVEFQRGKAKDPAEEPAGPDAFDEVYDDNGELPF